MKKLLLSAAIVALVCGFSATPAFAAKEKKKKKLETVENPLAKFDANKDGTLDKEELATLAKDAEVLKKFDKNGDGKLDDAEKTAAQDALKATPEPKKKKKKKDA
jgi:hypothetical protein